MPITVNWSDLEIAFERNSPDQESFLDLENGDLLSIVEGEPDAAARRARVASNPERYLRIDPASSREQYRWMERFVSSVADQPLRERLLIAIDGKGAFRRFKDVLLAFPAERERWFAYRSELLHFHIQTWLDHMRIEVANPPPWGHVAQPAEPAEIPRVAAVGRSAGRDPAPAGARSARRDPGRRAAAGARVPRVPARSRPELAARRGARQRRASPSLDGRRRRRRPRTGARRADAARNRRRALAARQGRLTRQPSNGRRSALGGRLLLGRPVRSTGGVQIQPSRRRAAVVARWARVAGSAQPSRAHRKPVNAQITASNRWSLCTHRSRQTPGPKRSSPTAPRACAPASRARAGAS